MSVKTKRLAPLTPCSVSSAQYLGDDSVDKTLDDMVRTLWEAAKENSRTYENFQPVVFFFSFNPENTDQIKVDVQPIMIPDGKKDLVSQIIKTKAHKVEAFAVMFVTEAWMLGRNAPPDEMERCVNGESTIAQSRYRVETLFANVETRKNLTFYSIKIDRSTGFKNLVDEDIIKTDASSSRGRFTHLLVPLL
jgi:hypothetical protein